MDDEAVLSKHGLDLTAENWAAVIHTGFRQASESAQASRAHAEIEKMPKREWLGICDYALIGVRRVILKLVNNLQSRLDIAETRVSELEKELADVRSTLTAKYSTPTWQMASDLKEQTVEALHPDAFPEGGLYPGSVDHIRSFSYGEGPVLPLDTTVGAGAHLVANSSSYIQCAIQHHLRQQTRIEKISRYLTTLAVGGCTCCTKTPELRYHKVDCRYRKATEAEAMLSDLVVNYNHFPSASQAAVLLAGVESLPVDGRKTVDDIRSVEKMLVEKISDELQKDYMLMGLL